jgi:two-component system, response regulator PdtaR
VPDHEPKPQLGPQDGRIVLVVEDEVLIRLDVAEELRLAGYSVLEAASAEEALDLFAAGSPVDIVFSDFQLLGVLDGWELRAALAEIHPRVPFILTSAQAPPDEAKAEALPFIPKPYCPEAVIEAIEGQIGKRRDGHGKDEGTA